MDTLTKLFKGIAYVKTMRLFLFNPETPFETADIKNRTRVSLAVARREVNYVFRLGLIKKRLFFKEYTKKKGKLKIVMKKKVSGWVLNDEFPYINPLRHMLLSSESFHKGNIVDRFKNVGKLKLLITSGLFVDEIQRTDTRGRVDVLLVGDKLKQNVIKTALKMLESEVGRELQYAIMDTEDFLYRRSVYDKFIRDILDYPHHILVDKLGI